MVTDVPDFDSIMMLPWVSPVPLGNATCHHHTSISKEIQVEKHLIKDMLATPTVDANVFQTMINLKASYLERMKRRHQDFVD